MKIVIHELFLFAKLVNRSAVPTTGVDRAFPESSWDTVCRYFGTDWTRSAMPDQRKPPIPRPIMVPGPFRQEIDGPLQSVSDQFCG